METEQNLSDGNKQIQSLGTLQQFTLDQDPRVRTSALEALVRSSALSSPVFFRVLRMNIASWQRDTLNRSYILNMLSRLCDWISATISR